MLLRRRHTYLPASSAYLPDMADNPFVIILLYVLIIRHLVTMSTTLHSNPYSRKTVLFSVTKMERKSLKIAHELQPWWWCGHEKCSQAILRPTETQADNHSVVLKSSTIIVVLSTGLTKPGRMPRRGHCSAV